MENNLTTSGKNIAVVGLWHLGCVYAASLAKMGFNVVGFDFDKKVVADLNKGIPPIFEPGLEEIIKVYKDSLSFTSNPADLKNEDYIFITHDLEVDENDMTNLKTMREIFAVISKNITAKTSVVISSQVPVGTSRILIEILKKKGIKKPKVVYFPENLRLGTAFSAFLEPDRIIIGSDNTQALDEFEDDFRFKCVMLKMNLESAEMVKHALNSYLATCISWSSEITDLAEKVGADMSDVVKALKLEKRVSPYAPISPGLGFAGGTIGRDVQALRALARNHKYHSKFFDAVYEVNKDRLSTLIKKIEGIYPKLKGKKIGLLGLTYKPNTNTLRRSMSLELAAILKERGCTIKAYDPAIREEIADASYVKITGTYDTFFNNLDMVVLMTDWKEFNDIDVVTMGKIMENKVVVDTKNFLDKNLYRKNKFTYFGIGIL